MLDSHFYPVYATPSAIMTRRVRRYLAVVSFYIVNLLGHVPTPDIPHASSGPGVECSPGVRDVMGSIPSQVIPKTLKMVLGAFLLSTRHLKVRPRKYGWFTHRQM